MAKNKLIVSNWKMNLNLSDSKKLINKLIKSTIKKKPYLENIICPQFLLIPSISNLIKNTHLLLGAQNCHFERKGAFTGESSIELLKQFNCKYVILGHSERRLFSADSNLLIKKKIKIVLSEKIKPIVCIGEPLEFRKDKSYLKFLEKQLDECVPECNEIIIAYEPIWSIGTGLVPDYEDIYEVQNYVKSFLKNKKFIKKTSVLYGGSVSSNNITYIIKESKVDGALIGGSSIDDKEILKIISIL
jgi:triosephosphate isomerase